MWDSTPNPYEGAPVNAPFDQKFYLVGTTTMAIHPSMGRLTPSPMMN